MFLNRSVRFRSSGYWLCPNGVSVVYINYLAGGGGGAYDSGINAGAGGGSGEFGIKFPVPVTPGTTYFVNIGEGGTRGFGVGITGNINATPGGIAALNGFTMLGGQEGYQDGAGTIKSAGGGPNGGLAFLAGSVAGTLESPTHFGGAAGGVTSAISGVAGAQEIGEFTSSAGSTGGSGRSGCGGGATIYANGGTGGSDQGKGEWAILGAGGGGSSSVASSSNANDGGNGGPGLIEIYWVQQ